MSLRDDRKDNARFVPSVMFIDGTRITPGTERCNCGPSCEHPCFLRVGIADACRSCGCPPFEGDEGL